MRKFVGFISLISLLSFIALFCIPGFSYSGEASLALPEVPVKGMITLVDLGGEQCPPCRMMAPFLRELRTEYEGKVAVGFVDVMKNPDQRQKFALKAIPTQIFYDKEGKEVSRHEGMMDKKDMVAILEKLGVKK